MDRNLLKRVFEYRAFIEIEDRYLVFKDYEIYDDETDDSVYYPDLEEFLKHEFEDGETLEEKLDKITFEFYYSGGRGSSSSAGMGGGFEKSLGLRRTDPSLPPAYFNRNVRFNNPEAAFKRFEDKYVAAKKEYGLSIDDQGFVHTHKMGKKNSVAIGAAGKNHTIIHNHPSGSNFSGADLRALAADSNAKGIIATGVKGKTIHRYSVQKGPKFDNKGFAKAINSAKWPKNYSYDGGVSWWLKRNQKKYGYTYTATKRPYTPSN